MCIYLLPGQQKYGTWAQIITNVLQCEFAINDITFVRLPINRSVKCVVFVVTQTQVP